jgi:hypothetical protein
MTFAKLFAAARLSPHYWREAMDIAYGEPPSRVVEKEKQSLARKLAAYARLSVRHNS